MWPLRKISLVNEWTDWNKPMGSKRVLSRRPRNDGGGGSDGGGGGGRENVGVASMPSTRYLAPS